MSNWMETVMNLNQLTEEEGKHLPDMTSFVNIAKTQAEISFKAGQESRYSISTVVDVGNDAFKAGRKAGTKEVTDFVVAKLHLASEGDYEIFEAKLKEWEV